MRPGPSQRRFQQRRIHDTAFAGNVAMLERRQRPDHGPHRGADIDNRHADPRRRAFGIAVDAENAAERLRHRLEGRQHLHRPTIAEARDVAIDQPRMTRADARRRRCPAYRRRPAAYCESGYPQSQASVQLLDAFGAFESSVTEALLRLMSRKCSESPFLNAAPIWRASSPSVRFFHFDDIGAEIGKDRRSIGAGQHLSDFDNADAFQHPKPFHGGPISGL